MFEKGTSFPSGERRNLAGLKPWAVKSTTPSPSIADDDVIPHIRIAVEGRGAKVDAIAVPRFATIQSMIDNSYLANAHRKVAMRDTKPIGRPHHYGDHSGWGAALIGEDIFGGSISADELLDIHSHLWLATCMDAEDDAVRTRTAQRHHALGSYNVRHQYVAEDVLESSELRRCPHCVASDVEKYGVAYWRIHHQWPFARHCAEHRTPLKAACSHCRMSPSLSLRASQAPTDDCVHCGSTAGFTDLIDDKPIAADPDAYWFMLDLAFRALQNKTPELRPEPRERLYAALNRGRFDQRDLLALTCSVWHASTPDDLAEQLGVNVFPHGRPYLRAKGDEQILMRFAVASTALRLARALHLHV